MTDKLRLIKLSVVLGLLFVMEVFILLMLSLENLEVDATDL